MADLSKASISTQKPVDKTVYTLSGSFTYSYTTNPNGGSYVVANPEPGTLFLADSIFSINGGNTWFGDLDGDMQSGSNLPDLNTCTTKSSIIYRWGDYGRSGSVLVEFRTKLLAVDL